MALPSTRIDFRIALSNVDLGVEASESLIVARHPSETAEHLVLRVLAWCLLYEPGLELGPGLSAPDTAALWKHDLTGRLVTWIECGTASAEKIRKAVQHNPGAKVHAVFGNERRRNELTDELYAWKRAEEVAVWTFDPSLVVALAQSEERRRRWAVTVVGDHFYLDADGATVDGAVDRYSWGARINNKEER